jgi:hypothetical protein
MVGETRLPAGNCEIQVMPEASDVVLVFRPQSGSAASAVATRISESNTEISGSASIVLDRRGGVFHLNSILFPDHSGYRLINVE